MRIIGTATNPSLTGNLPAKLYEKHAPALLSLCMRYCGNIQDAEDVLHEGFIKIIRNVGGFRDGGKGSFEGWMRRIMVNTALNYIRDHAKERKFLDIDPIEDRLVPDDDSEGEDFITGMAGHVSPQVVMDLICELPYGYRSVFNMYVFESYSHKEIAQALNFSENTSKSQLSKARSMLRKKLTLLMMKTETHEKA